MKINEVHSFLNYIRRKDPIGGSISIPEFNQVAQRAVFEFFKKIMGLPSQYQKGARDPVEGYGLNMIMEEKIRPLKVLPIALVVNLGRADYPTDYFRKSSAYTIQGDRSIVIPFVNDAKYNERRATVLDPPSLTDPVGNLHADKIRFLPDILTPVFLEYIKYPTSPIMGYVVDINTGENIYVERGAYCQVVTPGVTGNVITLSVTGSTLGYYSVTTGDSVNEVMIALAASINSNTLYHDVKAVFDGVKIVLIDLLDQYNGLLSSVSGSLSINKDNFTDWSVQFDWENDNEAMNDIIDIMLDIMGISNRDVNVVQWSQQKQAQ